MALARRAALLAPRAVDLRPASIAAGRSNRSGCFEGFFLVADLAMQRDLDGLWANRFPLTMPFSRHNWHVSSRGRNGGLLFFGEAAKSPPQSNSAGTLVPAEFNDEKIYFSASRPAWATSVSTTPLGPPPTPMAPIILPFTMIGRPPAAAVMPKESTVRPAPPEVTRSS